MLDKRTAYEKWLGIKGHDQPPTLYRLLGVDALESDTDAISNAADSRMAFLKQFQVGDNAPLAEQILNELSRARVTLLNAEKKAAYDARLRQRIAAPASAVASSKVPSVSNVSPLPHAESLSAPMQPAPKKKSNPLVWIIPAASVALVILAIVAANSLSGGGSSNNDAPKAITATSETPKPPEQQVAAEPSPSPKSLDKPPTVVPSHAVAPPVEPPTPTPIPAPDSPPVAVAASELPPVDSKKPTSAPPDETPKSPAAVTPSPTEPSLIPVPDVSAQADATKLVKEVYSKEWAAAKTADQKQALAKKLLERAMESGNDRVAQFVLFRLSKEVAEQAGDCESAFEAIDETAKAFQIDSAEARVDCLRKCAQAATTADKCIAVAERAVDLSERALSKEQFDVAQAMNDLALGEAHKAKDESLAARLAERKVEIERIAEEFGSAKEAIVILKTTPADRSANLAVGKFQCFFKGDWEAGLPKLARGDDPILKALAELDIKGGGGANGDVKIGDSWWKLSEPLTGLQRKVIQARAGYWYQQALPGLSGLARDKVAGRLQDIQQFVYLADLPAEEVRVHHGEPDTKTSFRGKSSPHTLWAHPPDANSSSHMAFLIDGRFRLLRGEIGIGTGANHAAAAPLTFRIVGDGKILWHSARLQERDVPISFVVHVAKVKKLELFVDCPGSHASAWALWIDPLLER